MKANKRTVWFLTLLSLVAVISIYYLNREAPMQFDGLAIFGDKDSDAITLTNTKDATKPVFAESVLFEEMRMQVLDERSKLKEQLEAKTLSSDYTVEEKNEAFNALEDLTKQTSAEALMEMQIKALGYPEVFVRKDNGKVAVTVLAQEGHSKELADEITKYIWANWDDTRQVKVDFTGN
ncbi:SpoIIIAH-like family protein [Sporosarcina cyprini]|uniref:SpoIIIAH-like family protein n=1 Tax=Sporosarcina cyprini TaxID=2910523 RepID=UPI001EE12994|nr:SpoIIIAH-like family protein [Sporosarcina cyprini]MCG3089039.1 SpoIIIAH-like family protein [Sporosarcina cyprini]